MIWHRKDFKSYFMSLYDPIIREENGTSYMVSDVYKEKIVGKDLFDKIEIVDEKPAWAKNVNVVMEYDSFNKDQTPKRIWPKPPWENYK